MQGEFNLELIKDNMNQLSAILATETSNLINNNVNALCETYEKKLGILQHLEDQKKILKANKGNLKISAEEKGAIKELALRMDSIIEQHGREVIKMREANKFLLEAIASVIRDHLNQNNSTVRSYNTNGKDGQNTAKGESDLPPMRINNTV